MTTAYPTGSIGATLRRLKGTLDAPSSAMTPGPILRPAPANDNQPDFFVPSLCDIALKDGIGLMDIACFRLGSKATQSLIRHDLPGVTVEVAGGVHGMATIHDYDIVLLMISQLTQAMTLWGAGRGPRPPMRLRLHAADILKFCRRGRGGRDYHLIDGALKRRAGTFIRIEARGVAPHRRRTGYFSLISEAEVLGRADNNRIEQVELGIPNWLYSGVMDAQTPEVLTLNPDYLLIKGGLARFIYRLARKAAGDGQADYGFDLVRARSGSLRRAAAFDTDLRALIAANDLPDYDLAEVSGASGSVLRMRRRT